MRGLLNNTAMVGELLLILSAGDMYGLDELYRAWKDPNDDNTELSCTISALGYVDIIRIPLPVLEKHVFPNLERTTRNTVFENTRNRH